MKKISKYLLSAFATVAISIAIANVSALAACTTEVADEYTCYPSGEDETNCYYNCYWLCCTNQNEVLRTQ